MLARRRTKLRLSAPRPPCQQPSRARGKKQGAAQRGSTHVCCCPARCGSCPAPQQWPPSRTSPGPPSHPAPPVASPPPRHPPAAGPPAGAATLRGKQGRAGGAGRGVRAGRGWGRGGLASVAHGSRRGRHRPRPAPPGRLLMCVQGLTSGVQRGVPLLHRLGGQGLGVGCGLVGSCRLGLEPLQILWRRRQEGQGARGPSAPTRQQMRPAAVAAWSPRGGGPCRAAAGQQGRTGSSGGGGRRHHAAIPRTLRAFWSCSMRLSWMESSCCSTWVSCVWQAVRLAVVAVAAAATVVCLLRQGGRSCERGVGASTTGHI